MRRILITDLDGTLVKFDTFKFWLVAVFVLNPLKFISYMISNDEVSFRGVIKFASIQSFNDLGKRNRVRLSKNYAEYLAKKLPIGFWNFVDCFKPTDILLLSASPSVYVKELGSVLGINAFGTDVIENRLYLMKNENKQQCALKYLRQFSVDDYVYAVGNTSDDISFMSLADDGNFIHFSRNKKIVEVHGYAKMNWVQLRNHVCDH